MIIKKKLLRILADRPDLFGRLPDGVLSEETRNHLRMIPNLAFAVIDELCSSTAVSVVLREKKIDGLVPTVVYTGTEFGPWENRLQACAALKKDIERSVNIYVSEPVVLGSPPLWNALSGRHFRALSHHYGFATCCCSCIIYICAVHIPVMKLFDAGCFLSGSCCGCLSAGMLSQHENVRNYCRMFMSGFGIEHVQKGPDRDEEPDSAMPCREFGCVLESGPASERTPVAGKFFEEFAIPAAAKTLSSTLAGAPRRYHEIIDETLLPIAGTKPMMNG